VFCAALVPLRVYPSGSVPFKDLCMAGNGSGERKAGRTGYTGPEAGEGLYCYEKAEGNGKND